VQLHSQNLQHDLNTKLSIIALRVETICDNKQKGYSKSHINNCMQHVYQVTGNILVCDQVSSGTSSSSS
jgi:hypothetical protein